MKMQKFLAALLALVMVLTLLPMAVFAAEGDEGESTDTGLELSKNTVLQADGTYTITLKAYATGTVTTSTTTTPTDIVLVLDDSGSMDDTMEYRPGYAQIRRTFQTVTNSWLLTNYADNCYYKLSDGTYAKVTITTTPNEEGYFAFSDKNNSDAYSNQDNLYVKLADGTYSKVTVTREETGNFIFTTLYKYTYSAEGMESVTTADNANSSTNPWNGSLYTYELAGACTQYTYTYQDGTETKTLTSSADGADEAAPGTFYYYGDTAITVSYMDGLQEAAIAFVEATEEKNSSVTNADEKHRIAIVSFEDDATTLNNLTVVDSTGADTLISSINGLTGDGATNAAAGLANAKTILESSDRQKVVVFFTDGVPTTASAFSYSVAASAITNAKAMKDDDVTIFSISVMADANPADTSGTANGASTTALMNTYMNAVSSNYPEATATGSSDSYSVSLNDGGNNGYYKKATNVSDLTSIFQDIQNSVGSTTVTLGANAVMKDIIGDSFVLPGGADYDISKVTVQTADYLGNDQFADPVAFAAAEVSVGDDNKSIEVTNFSYKDNYCLEAYTNNGEAVPASGKMLIVTIPGIEINPENFVAGSEVPTNAAGSGIYEDDTLAVKVQDFETPVVTLGTASYVLDYAKPATVNSVDWAQQTLVEARNLIGTYGDLSAFESGATTLTYNPKTMNWDGYDSFFTLGTTGVETAPYNWAKINFIPANNVYYEDSFVTNTNGVTAGIEFSQDYEITTGTNSEQVDTEVHGGWQNVDLADDLTFSDGTAVEMGKGAKATFTFTGTGVDVYTRTNAESGAIRGKLYTVSEVDGTTTAKLAKVLYVDNLAVSGDYYQIPSLTFSGLEHGTYKLELTVYSPTAADEAERATYYLDGIRIYNPLSDKQEAEDEVQDAYTEKDDQNNVTGTELNALFTEVRDMLITAGNFNPETDKNVSGVVFIDDIDEDGTEEPGESTSVIATYEELGPKNEVYLAAGQSIAFMVNGSSSNFYALGLKAPAGETKAEFTNGTGKSEMTIGHSTDLYYEITPSNSGIIVVKNTGSNLLSITKLKTTGLGTVGESGIMTASVDDLMAYSNEFDTLPMMAYAVRPPVVEEPEATEPEVTEPEVTEPEATEPEATEPEVTEPEVTEPEATEPEIPEIEIEIENPDPKPETKPDNGIRNLVKKLFGFLSKWF